jgi:uncharacterized protein (TIGR03086 family)
MNRWDVEVQHLLTVGRDREAAELAARHLAKVPPDRGATLGPLEQLDQLAPLLGGVIAGVEDNQLDLPTPCAEFTVAGVLEHMLTGASAFGAAFRGEAPGPVPEDGRLPDRVITALELLVESMHAPGALDRTIEAPFGVVPGETFARFVVLDGLVHGWDLATATGQPYAPSDALASSVLAFATEAVPPLRDGSTFANEATARATATPIERLVAFTGRHVPEGANP